MTEEEAEIIRCNRYFDIIDTVSNKINTEIKISGICVLTKTDWDVISDYLQGMNNILQKYIELK